MLSPAYCPNTWEHWDDVTKKWKVDRTVIILKKNTFLEEITVGSGVINSKLVFDMAYNFLISLI